MKYSPIKSDRLDERFDGRVFAVELEKGETQRDLISAIAEAISLGTCGENVSQESRPTPGRWMIRSDFGQFAVGVQEVGRQRAVIVVARCQGSAAALLEATKLFMRGEAERKTIPIDVIEVDDWGNPCMGFTLHATPVPFAYVPATQSRPVD